MQACSDADFVLRLCACLLFDVLWSFIVHRVPQPTYNNLCDMILFPNGLLIIGNNTANIEIGSVVRIKKKTKQYVNGGF